MNFAWFNKIYRSRQLRYPGNWEKTRQKLRTKNKK